MNLAPFYFDFKSLISPERWLWHESTGYYTWAYTLKCSKYNIEYNEETMGAVYIGPNMQGLYVPLFFVGPEYITDNSLCINNKEDIIKEIKAQKSRFDF